MHGLHVGICPYRKSELLPNKRVHTDIIKRNKLAQHGQKRAEGQNRVPAIEKPSDIQQRRDRAQPLFRQICTRHTNRNRIAKPVLVSSNTPSSKGSPIPTQ